MLNLRFVVGLAIALTILSALESCIFPWSPYFVIYAILTITIPIYFKTYKIKGFDKNTVKLFAKFLLISIVFMMLSKLGYALILEYLSLAGNVFYDMDYALFELGKIVGDRLNMPIFDAMLIYGFYMIVWAPIGEELFYRGFLFEMLNRKYPFAVSALISSLFFGVRHLVHFLLLPRYPVFAGLFYFYITFFYGLIMTYAYKKTENIYVPIGLHLLTNVILILLLFYSS